MARAGRLYGVPPDLFWVLTPSDLDAIANDWLDERKASDERDDRRIAAILAAIHNAAGKSFRKTFEVPDFMPKRSDERLSGDALLMKANMIAAKMKAIFPENN